MTTALPETRSRSHPTRGPSVPGLTPTRPRLSSGPFGPVLGKARLVELRLEPGPRPRLHLRVTHPVHREVVITIAALPTGVRVEVRCADPGTLARSWPGSSRWPRGSRRLRVRFLRS